MITPFLSDGKVDFSSLEKMVEHVIKGRVEYIVALGTTAETPALGKDEKDEVVKAIIRFNNGRVPVVLGMGGNNTGALVDDIHKQDFNGISAVLSVAPYYNKPGQEGMYQHFKAVAQASPLPVILYNVPGRTGSNISATTCLRLAGDFSNIIAVKEASGNFTQIMEIMRSRPEHFHVLSGDDAITFPMITLGGSGVISVVANAFPGEFSEMTRLTLEHKISAARKIHYKMLPIIENMFAEGNPAGVKAYLHAMGLIENNLRLPLVRASEELNKKIRESVF